MRVAEAGLAEHYLLNDDLDNLMMLERLMETNIANIVIPSNALTVMQTACLRSQKCPRCIRWLFARDKLTLDAYPAAHRTKRTLLHYLVSDCKDFSLIRDFTLAMPSAWTRLSEDGRTPMNIAYIRNNRVALNVFVALGLPAPIDMSVYTRHRYDRTIRAHALCRSVAAVLVRLLRPALNRDMARLIGQYVYNTRCYEEWWFKVSR